MNDKALKLATYIVCDSLDIGGNWGFVLQDNPEYADIIDILRSEPSFKIIELQNGLLLLCDKNYITKICSQILEDSLSTLNFWRTQENNRLSSGISDFQKYLTKIYQNNISPTYKGNGYNEYTFGIFSCNKSGHLRINCLDYPAFNLKLNEIIQSLLLIGKKKKLYVYSSEGFKLIQSYDNLYSIYKGLEISNSLNGALMTIRVGV